MGKKMSILAAILALFLVSGQMAWAQTKVGSDVITAETQFYLKQLEVKNQRVMTRGSKARLREAKLFVVCKPEADVNAVNSYDESFNRPDADSKPDFNPFVAGAIDDHYCFASLSGTSMATPTAAGIIALWLEAKPDMTYDEMKEALAASAITDDFTNALPIRYGNGKIDAYGGLLHILGIPNSIPELSRHQPQNISFRIDGNRLAIAGAPEGTPIRVYTTAGILITDSALQDGGISLPATAAPGVYAVQVGNYGSTLIRK